jgi:hypothetical protein
MDEVQYYKPEGHGLQSDEVIVIFNLANPPSSTMVLGFTEPLILVEMSTRKSFRR